MRILIAFSATILAATTHAGTVFVDDDAAMDPGPGDCLISDVDEDGSSDHPWDCIGEAIASAVDGDEIIVAPGTYAEAIDFGGKAITLRSADGPDVTMIDVTGLGVTAVVFASGEGEGTVMDGFTITGAEGVDGGGMLISFASPTLRNLKFHQNTATHRGGGLYSEHGLFTMTDCEFRENESELGGAVSLFWGQATLVGTLLVDNESSAYGGGIHCAHSSPLIVDCRFQGNEAYDDGNGMFIRSGSDPTIIDCIFEDNRGRGDGGGIATFASCSPTIVGCDFEGNRTWLGQHNNGGGMMARGAGADPLIIDCRFIDNGVVGGDFRKGGGLWSSHGASPVVVGCDFLDNFADWGGGAGEEAATPVYIDCVFDGNVAILGGALYTSVNASTRAINCVFSWNIGEKGGAVWEKYGNRSFYTNCLFVHNRAVEGGAIYSGSYSEQTITNATIHGNVADRGAGVYAEHDSGATVCNSILWENTAGDGHPAIWDEDAVEVTYCLVERGWPGVAIFSADPMFAADLIGYVAGRSDLRLRHGSPAIDAGNAALLPADVTDLDGDGDTTEPLPVDITGRSRELGTAVDLGVFEHSPRKPADESPPSFGGER